MCDAWTRKKRIAVLLVLSLGAVAWLALAGGVIDAAGTADAADAADAPKPADAPKAKQPAPAVDFVRDVQPIFAQHCVACHGPKKQKGGLRLDIKQDAFAELETGERALVAGQPDKSRLLALVKGDEFGDIMPPKGKPLSEAQIELLARWIESGANWPDSASAKRTVETDHWAYQPIEPHAPPAVKRTDWPRNAIDRFVLATLESKNIAPSPPADRYTLIKRLYYDLIGLPPTPAEVDAFVNDASPDAYEKLVDRLLASPHFGERWGRHWLDKARYADSDGYEKDRPRPNAWRYRDWVIDAVNADLPFDRFTIEQLAGDLLVKEANAATDKTSPVSWNSNASPNPTLATAFHRQTLTNTEGGTDQEEFRVEATFDRTETTGTIWLGLTVTCARCHTHKYDQITQREYYQLYDFFNDANESTANVPRDAEVWAAYETKRKAHEQHVRKIEQRIDAARQRLAPQVESWAQRMRRHIDAATKQPVAYEPLEIVSNRAGKGVTLIDLADGSLLATGPVHDKDKYTLVVKTKAKEITGLRVDALTDDKLPKQGPGRTPHGNFVLTELRAYVSPDPKFKRDYTLLKFAVARHSFAQDGFPAESALDVNQRNGWAISPQMGKPHHAEFAFKRPVTLGEGRYLQVVLDQQYGGKHLLGRFKVRAITGVDPSFHLPPAVLAALKAEPDKRTQEQRTALLDHFASQQDEVVQLQSELAKLEVAAPQPPLLNVRVITAAQRKTRLLHRGDFLQPKDEVQPGALAVIERVHPLEPRDADQGLDRLDLAHWLVHRDNPLTPRVAVNHVWAKLFGRGIVATVNDFGVRGEKPTHPKLLDYLARQFVTDMAWSRKRLIKTIVMSATYGQSSAHGPALAEIDPTNRLLHRQNRVRVEAEIIRDLHLAAAGLLSDKLGGPSVFPPLPPGVAELSYANNFKWKTSEGEGRYRRGMYTFFKRTSPHPTLISFDCPDANTTNVQRSRSNTPLQALATLNNEVFVEAAQHLAKRVLAEAKGDDRVKLTRGMRLVMTRVPDSDEVDAFLKLLRSARDYYKAHPDDAKQLTSRHRAEDVSVAENAAWVATMRMVMNVDEFIVRD